MLDTNNTCNWKIGTLIVVTIVVIILFGCRFLVWHNYVETEKCVLTQPLVAVSGYISHLGIAEGGATSYTFTYSGMTKVTGESCALDVLVTLSEYERVMYGRGD